MPRCQDFTSVEQELTQGDAMNPWWTLAALVVVFGAGWAWQKHRQDATSVDVIWSFALAAQALTYALAGDGDPVIRVTLAVLGGGWGLRLGTHLLARSGGGEDGRYAFLREHWGEQADRNFIGVYAFQAAIAWAFGLVFWAVAEADRGGGLDGWWLAGLIVWIIAVGGEWLADHQLKRWKQTHDEGVCDVGLWRYSRHPNYFFEIIHWVAYPLLGWSAPWWWLTALGPFVMWAFVWRISGIPWAEQQSLRSRGEAYRAYQQRTPALFPWFPKDA